MCKIFASQDPATYACATRSVRLCGHATSIRLEALFWEILEEIARREGLALPKFLNTLYREALEIQGEVVNFASLLRVACLVYLGNRAAHAAPAVQRPAFQVEPRAAGIASAAARPAGNRRVDPQSQIKVAAAQ